MTLTADESLVVILIGHAHLNESSSQFNVLDADFDQKDFANWTSALPCREQIFLLTQPLSGFWIRSLKQHERIVISATEPDLEFTGTEMPYALAHVLAGTAEHCHLHDIDNDGQLSLLDLYIAANLEIEGRFFALERLQTEHARIDDNCDGRGTEIQQAYLPVRNTEPDDDEADDTTASSGSEALDTDDSVAPESDSESAVNPRKPPLVKNENLDGYRSRFVLLHTPSDEAEAAEESQD
jgi:hypothetical protein